MLLRQLNDPVPRVMAPQVPASVPLAEPKYAASILTRLKVALT